MKLSLKTISKNPYVQTVLALLITVSIVFLLANFMFRPNLPSNLQLASIISIGITLLLFFGFSLWKVNQQKQWISLWAKHPFWVLITFFTLPLLFTIIFNISAFSSIITEELLIRKGPFFFPHFMFFYFWEALIFSIAFLAHPERKNIKCLFSLKQILLSLILGSGLWSAIMFLNEIQLQWALMQISYLEIQSFFWPVVPLAIIIIPISVSFVLFHDIHKLSLPKKIFILILFGFLPLRTICLLPAFIMGVVFIVINRKENAYQITILTYAFYNLFTLLLNWIWVI